MNSDEPILVLSNSHTITDACVVMNVSRDMLRATCPEHWGWRLKHVKGDYWGCGNVDCERTFFIHDAWYSAIRLNVSPRDMVEWVATWTGHKEERLEVNVEWWED